MKETTLVHIVRDGCVLMMHRISKKDDINHGKWIGVGGKFEKGETPEACMRREVWEETGLAVDQYRYCGIVTFVSDENETEYMHLFTATGFEGELIECDEGELRWIPKKEILDLPLWEGDREFLQLLYNDAPFFTMKVVYHGDNLIETSHKIYE
jgi:8-oxo-dGTP diphosphatase